MSDPAGALQLFALPGRHRLDPLVESAITLKLITSGDSGEAKVWINFP